MFGPWKLPTTTLHALRDIESLMTATANTAAGQHLEALAMLVEHYERVHYPMEPH